MVFISNKLELSRSSCGEKMAFLRSVVGARTAAAAVAVAIPAAFAVSSVASSPSSSVSVEMDPEQSTQNGAVLPELLSELQSAARAGWYQGMREKKDVLPEIVKAGDPVLHEPAQEVRPEEIGSDRIQKIIDAMVKVMRAAPGVGLAAPQIGIPLKIIVLEDTIEYISYTTKEEIMAQNRQPFDLLVVINPKLKKKGNQSAFFFEGCLSVNGFGAIVERHSEVEVTGFDRFGQAIRVDASGWQARIFQHECDHLDGTLYVDKMVPRTFRTAENLDLPLAAGCPKLGAR